MCKRITSLFLALLLVFLAIPFAVLSVAAEDGDEQEPAIRDLVLSTSVFARDKAGVWPVFAKYNSTTMTVGQYVDVTYPGAWQIGYKTTAGESANFTPYKKLYKANTTGTMILSADNNYYSLTGGMYVTDEPGLLFSGMTFTAENTTATHTADPTIRYTAEYTGTATVRLNKLFFCANDAAYLDILHNGEPIIDPYKAIGATNRGADLGVLVVKLTEGDTLDFVSRANEDFADPDLAARGLSDYEIEISYLSEKKESHTVATGEMTFRGDMPLPLFVWYNGKGEQLLDKEVRATIPTFTGGALNEGDFSFIHGLIDWVGVGSYAKINPALIASGLIREGDDYTAILAAYRAYLKTFTVTAEESGFGVGILQGSSLSPLDRFGLVGGRNLFSVKQNGSYLAAEVDYGFTTDRLTDEASLDAALDAFFANAAAITPAGTSAANYRISVDALPEGMEFSTEGTEAAGAVIKNGDLYLSPTEGSATALSYTLPASMDHVIFSFAPTALAFDGAAAAFRYAIAVNGTVVWPAGASAQPNNAWAEAASLANMQDALASLSFAAKGGDTVSLYLARAEDALTLSLAFSVTADNYHSVRALSVESEGKSVFRGLYELGSTVMLDDLGLPATFAENGVFINYATEVSELPESLEMNRDYHIADRLLESYASISITSSFAINLYVKAENGADEAGVIIDGKKQAGTPMGNGLYRITLPVAPKDMPTTEISYQAYQTLDGADTVNAASVTLRAFDLLSRYEASEDASTKLLASTIRYYSLAARDYFVNGQVTLSTDAQTALRESDPDIQLMVDAYKAGTAYRPYPDGTNVNAFAFRIKGASLKPDDRLAFAFRVDRTSGAAFGDASLYLRVTDANGEVRYLSEGEPFDETGLEMLYFVKNLRATEYGTNFYFTLVDANGAAQSATLTYSAHAYIARTFDTANGDATTFHYLLRGIYALGEASAAYASYHVDYDKNYFSPVGDGGDDLAENDPVLSGIVYNPNNATDIPSSSLASATLTNGGVYRIEGTVTFASGTSFNGRGAILLAPGGLVIDGANGFTLSNVTVVGPVVIRHASGVILENCRILCDTGTALTVEASASDVVLNQCRVEGYDAVENAANELTVMNSYLGFTRFGVHDTAENGTTVENCRLVGLGAGNAIYSTASEASFRKNTILLENSAAYGIVLDGDGATVNVLVAQNVISGAYESVTVSRMLNTSVVLNSVVLIRATNNKNLYVCDNAIGGRLMLENNDYLLADGNTYPADAKDHAAHLTENSNTNGDDITDVDARLDVGANEELLPHIDKDLFTHMERKTTVKEVNASEESSVYDYIEKHAAKSPYVVVAPGAYTTEKTLNLSDKHLNTTLYAYGVYVERTIDYTSANTENARHIVIEYVSNFTFKGMTIGYAEQSNGQLYILEKLENNQILAVAGAGFANDFSLLPGSTYFGQYRTEFGLQRAGEESYGLGEFFMTKVTRNADDTMTITLDPIAYDAVKKGDVMTCRYRLTFSGGTVAMTYATDISFRDFTQYGTSHGIGFSEKEKSIVTYLRMATIRKNGLVIDKDTYDRYAALQAQYGVDLEISIDELPNGEIRYRGAPAHVSSIDTIHANSSKRGSQVKSCLLDGMCDDATNQKSQHARLSEVFDNGDGTATIVYKANLSRYIFGSKGADSTFSDFCPHFKEGDRVYIYTSDGQLVCDATALADKVECEPILSNCPNVTQKEIKRYMITVDADKINYGALDGFNLEDDSYLPDEKVLVDNLSAASYGFFFDNCLIQNGEANGVRAKASGGTVKNCTFRNMAKTVTAMMYDIWWGESGVARDYTFKNNLIENTGYAKYDSENYRYTPIYIEGLGGNVVDEEHMLFKDILITGNKFVDRCLDNYNVAILARAVANLTITNNDFGTAEEEDGLDKIAGVLYLDRVVNVELSGNTYSPYVQNFAASGNYTYIVTGDQYKNVHGDDVGDNIPDKLN